MLTCFVKLWKVLVNDKKCKKYEENSFATARLDRQPNPSQSSDAPLHDAPLQTNYRKH